MSALDQIASSSDVFKVMMVNSQPCDNEAHSRWRAGRLSGALFVMMINGEITPQQLLAAEKELVYWFGLEGSDQ